MNFANFYQRIVLAYRIRLCHFVDFLATLLPKPEPKQQPEEQKVLLVRLDAIGDYVLFRNFIEVFAQHQTYKNSKLVFCGNVVWKDLFLLLDKDCFSEQIWIDRKKFFLNPIYRFQIQKKIYLAGFQTVIVPTFSRMLLYDDAIAKVSKAKKRIANAGNTDNTIAKEKQIADAYYTQLLAASPTILFEFARNKEFFENLLSQKIAIHKPAIENAKISGIFAENAKISGIFTENAKIPTVALGATKKPVILLFVGGSEVHKRWAAANYAQLAAYLHQRHQAQIKIVGDRNDAQIAEQIMVLQPAIGIENLAGKTTLTALLGLIKNANLLIANESSGVHLAASLQIPTICLSNNTWHIGRFNPYPAAINLPVLHIFPIEFDFQAQSFEQINQQYNFKNCLAIDLISVEKVAKFATEILDNNPKT
jgi:ADP-heptose:LPS heptosyltransferase